MKNMCLLLVIVSIVLTTAAQDIPINFSSTEHDSVNSSKTTNNFEDIFEEDELIEYSTLVTTPAQDIVSSITTMAPDTDDPVTIDPKRTTPEMTIDIDANDLFIETVDPSENEFDSDIFNEDEVIEYSTYITTPAQDKESSMSPKTMEPDTKDPVTSLPTIDPKRTTPEMTIVIDENILTETKDEDESDLFKEDEVIEYSTLTTIRAQNSSISPATMKPDTVQSNTSASIITTFNNITIPESNLSINIDFVDWDLMNDNETTLFGEFNQTILTEIMKRRNNRSSTTVGIEVISTPKATTTPSPSHPTTPAPSSTTSPAPSHPTTPVSSSRTTPLITYVLDKSLFEPDEPETIATTLSYTITTQPPDSEEGEDDSGDFLEINIVTDDPDYGQAQDDPCNYEKITHPLPEIEKSGRRVSEIKCEEYMWDYTINVLDVERYRNECAEQMARRNEIATQIVGGAKARQGDFPHMGAVGWIHSDGSYRWMCGSSLISPRFTITAAHCRSASSRLQLRYTEPRVVRFGSVFLESKDNVTNKLTAHDVLIAEFLVLEAYAREPIKKYNDIGLIRLQEEVQATLLIKPACLWTGFLGNDWVANITGWGKTTNSEGSESNHLRYAEVDFVEQSTCRRYIHGRRNRHWSQGLKDHQFCAGKLQGGIDACEGDSGGPLSFREPMPAAMNNTDAVHRIVGITSFGIKCAYPFLPGVYTNITSFICWIEKNVWPEEYNAFCP